MAPHDVQSEAEMAKLISKGLSVADFYAPWCGACKKFMPDYEELSANYPSAQFLKVDVDELEDMAAASEVNGLPYLIVYKNGALVERLAGKDVLKSKLAAALDAHSSADGAPPTPGKKEAAPAASAAPATAGNTAAGSDAVEFKDAGSGNAVRFAVQTTMRFSVNGEDRPCFDKMLSDGGSKLAFPTIGKAVTLPAEHKDEIIAKLVTMAARANVATEGFKLKVPTIDVSFFSCVDPNSGNTLSFYADVEAKKVQYSVNGEPRPGFTKVASDGNNRVSFTDVGKGCALPRLNLHIHIASLLSVVQKVGGQTSGFPSEVSM
ncbi:Thioredoxin-1 [Diplonema papillatum]|nr:Thioredoxin-1 [Diplonema papillatum]